MYKLIKNPYTQKIDVVQKQVGDVLYSIPFDPMNTDYQEYLKWVAEGGVPLPPDSQE
jgi:hypothetical protein